MFKNKKCWGQLLGRVEKIGPGFISEKNGIKISERIVCFQKGSLKLEDI